MKPILKLLTALLLAPLAALNAAESAPPVIYVTDFYHPYADPDDHFDMACVFSLAFQKKIDLRGICLDHTREGVLDGTEKRKVGDPDIVGVAQLQAITGFSVPVAVGSSRRLRSSSDAQADAKPGDLAAARLILHQLQEATSPVAIIVGGGCRDVALALLHGREVFEKKCRAIYWLGSVAEYRDERALPEANYGIDPAAFQSVMNAPCPVYWLPGFGRCEPAADGKLRFGPGDYSALWTIRPQGDVLAAASPVMQRYFLYMFREGHQSSQPKPHDPAWLRYLAEDSDHDVLAEETKRNRAMWTTPALLHVANLYATASGDIATLGSGQAPSYQFVPIKLITAHANGRIDWRETGEQGNRFILKQDRSTYPNAMTKAVKNLLEKLP